MGIWGVLKEKEMMVRCFGGKWTKWGMELE